MNIKEDFHQFIDSIEDEGLLKSYYELIQKINEGRHGDLWNDLNEEQRNELLASYDESFDRVNQLSHEQVMLQYEKWLKP